MSDTMQNTTGFETEHNTPANNDADRARAPKKGHGYPVPAPRAFSPDSRGAEPDGSQPVSLDGSESHVSHCEGTPFPSDKGAKGGFAKNVGQAKRS